MTSSAAILACSVSAWHGKLQLLHVAWNRTVYALAPAESLGTKSHLVSAAIRSRHGRTPQPPAASSASVLRPASLPVSPKCSSCSIGPPDLPPTVRRSRLGQTAPRLCSSPTRADKALASILLLSVPTISAMTSRVSRCTGAPRLHPLRARFTLLRRIAMLLHGSISLSSVIAPLSALINGSLMPLVIGDRPSHPI
jgi:hypothetical protein